MTRTRPRSSIAAAAVVGLLLVTLAACADGSEGADDTPSTTEATTPSADEVDALERTIVDLPAELRAARYPVWSADGEALVFSALAPDGDTVEIYRIAPDGTGLACLTCDVARGDDEPYLKPIAFADGERILIRLGEQSPVTNGTHAVIECAPSVADCATATLVPIEVPATDDEALRQPQREFRIAPDGETVGFTQVRADAEGAERFVAIVGHLRREDDRYVVDDPRAITALGELKNFTPDGTEALVSAFTTLPDRAADPDVIAIDLATGDQRDITDNGDYDEDLAFAPDGGSYAVFSARTSGLFETVSQLRRPNDVGP
ncbi:MAG: hypothetical protein KDA97_02070, partial [Acidimicrobiales bacterium]|nr:hypothetical protein [Acidimicrobiales bacterium]